MMMMVCEFVFVCVCVCVSINERDVLVGELDGDNQELRTDRASERRLV